MNVLNVLLLLSFIAGLVPSVVFTVLYAARSAWSSTEAGRAIMTLMLVVAGTYLSGVATLVYPEFFRNSPGLFLRLLVRVACAIALCNLLRVLVKVQRREHSRH